MGKINIAIINKAFWPESPAIGASLLQVAERLSVDNNVVVITQTKLDLRELLSERGSRVRSKYMRCRTNSNSGLILRGLESILFMFWVVYSLFQCRPQKVYVSTNPPIFVPLVAAIYCRIFRAKLVYHLQDIHPEATNTVIPMNKYLFCILQFFDNFSVKSSSVVITLTQEMKDYISKRSKGKQVKVVLCSNPGIDNSNGNVVKCDDIVFCGNMGRVQCIPLLVESISRYIESGGRLKFTFIGDGYFSAKVEKLSFQYDSVSFLGYKEPVEASEIVSRHRWALLPIEDEITKFAFPSKSSSYVMLGCNILAICSNTTSVSSWVNQYKLGLSIEPNYESVVKSFFKLERNEDLFNKILEVDELLLNDLRYETHVKNIAGILDEL